MMQMLQDVLDQIKNVPATFWGVLFGSILTLAGVIISNRASDKRFRMQLKHDVDTKRIDRDIATKKAIYLDAVEAISLAVQCVGQLPNLNVPHEDILKPYIQKNSSVAKIFMVCDLETAANFQKLLSHLGKAVMILIVERVQLSADRESLIYLGKTLSSLQDEINSTIESMKQYNIRGDVDERLWSVLQQNYNFSREQQTSLLKQQAESSKTIIDRTFVFTKKCMAEVEAVGAYYAPVISSMRKELDMTVDYEHLTEIMQRSMSFAKQNADRSLDLVKAITDNMVEKASVRP